MELRVRDFIIKKQSTFLKKFIFKLRADIVDNNDHRLYSLLPFLF